MAWWLDSTVNINERAMEFPNFFDKKERLEVKDIKSQQGYLFIGG